MRLVWQAPSPAAGCRRPHRSAAPGAGAACTPGAPARSATSSGASCEGGCGALVVLDGALALKDLPAPTLEGQVVVLAPWLPAFWGGRPLPDLKPWRKRGVAAGVLLCLGPSAKPFDQVNRGIDEAKEAGAAFVLPQPALAAAGGQAPRLRPPRGRGRRRGAGEPSLPHRSRPARHGAGARGLARLSAGSACRRDCRAPRPRRRHGAPSRRARSSCSGLGGSTRSTA